MPPASLVSVRLDTTALWDSDSPTPDVNTTGESGPCPVGHYCPQGTVSPLKCPLGTFNSNTKATNESSCTPCSYGQYCGTEGLGEPSGPCWAGFFCLLGAKYPNNPNLDSTGGPCPVGHHCPNGTSYPLGCNAGSYSMVTGLAECVACPAGFYCPENATDYSGTPCPTGHYCPQGTAQPNDHPCDRGSYNNYTQKQSNTDCVPCEPGLYCETSGLTYPTGPCSQGWYCVRGAWSDKPTEIGNYTASNCSCPADLTGGQCQPGQFCPQGSSEPQACLPGNIILCIIQ